MHCDVMIIGGTGIGDRLPALGLQAVHVPTQFGLLRGYAGKIGRANLFCVQRHSAGHKTPPHLINYRAIADGARRLGVRACFATAAVGCLRPEWQPGTLVACKDFIDHTDRQVTMYDQQVRHIDFSTPMSARSHILAVAHGQGINVIDDGVYMGLDGPRYETPSEVLLVAKLGGDVVGMTASTEAEVMVEAGIPYACLAIVTNLAAGIADHVLDHSEVVDVMKTRGDDVLRLLTAAADHVVDA
ncbi:MAG: MTAP family purine nucleoside phosphorylase [Chthonomonas sp.]|nr:MTAP family purine nucleoside phosphorylase [Chthonomonas sp.]